jgi:HAE1 family hydrophobic/amphiphilic exporter-1
VVLFFLGRWRAMFIIILAIPVSLISSFIYLFVTGGSINIISLSSLTIAIGMVVDDAIVVLENITQHIERGSSPRESAIYGTNEVWLAVLASTMTVIAVFLPLTMVGGMAGILFKQLGWIVCITITVSLVAAFTLTPMLAAKMLNFQKEKTYKGLGIIFKPIEKFLDGLDSGYAKILTWSVRHRTFLIIASIVIFASSILLVFKVPVEFMPASDDGQITATIEMEQGRSLEYTNKITDQIIEYIQANFPEVETTSTTTGAADGSSIFSAMRASGSHMISITMRCSDAKDRDRDIFMMADLMRDKFNTIPEIVKYVVTTGSTGGAMLGGGGDIEVKVFGFDFDVSEKFAKDLMAKIQEVKGTRDLQLSREGDF